MKMTLILILILPMLASAKDVSVEDKGISYVVESGDTLMTVSNKLYGTHQKWQKILEANPDIDSANLQVGQVLFVPAPIKANDIVAEAEAPVVAAIAEKTEKPVEKPFVGVEAPVVAPPAVAPEELRLDRKYKIKKGDHLSSISYKFYNTTENISWIIAANPGLIPKNLKIGKVIVVPKVSEKVGRYIEEIEDQEALTITRTLPTELPVKKVVPSPEPPPTAPAVVAEVQRAPSNDDKKTLELELANRSLVVENQKLREELLILRDAKDLLSTAEREIKTVRGDLMSCKAQKDDRYVQQLQPMASIAETQAQLLQEKARLLSQRYWLTKNKQSETCELRFENNDKYKKEEFLKLVQYLNTELGSNYVFAEPGENSIKFQIPGRAVYGYANPTFKAEYEKIISQISRQLERLPVQKFEIVGHISVPSVFTEKNEKVSGPRFVMRQAAFLQNYFVENLGWKSQDVASSAMVGSVVRPNDGDNKLFEFTIRFRNYDDGDSIKKDRRGVASIRQDPLLNDLGTKILASLGELELASAEINDDALEINIARLYLFEANTLKLSEAGKQRLAKLMSILSNVDDARFELVWVAGQTEGSRLQTQAASAVGLENIKYYLVDDLKLSGQSLQMSYWSSQRSVKDAFNDSDDRVNRRLIIRVIANSRITRPYSGK